ncbi:hypothetical protein P170DRAFT_478052 [Aspergillus steynii IBT 23096]|uniref:Protein kinase domain-containing protein n=1 Tax=Aspergillus steynii IBT 23096 TaxID=1392250 RepID=A0A2I2G2U4_9EURO|nr:uncharacterized protein P170DRAFT_478052 [Aspergillus steynii IBT 23096]PLB47192.1 hypothetical protein P170DRAFT_478052 [Aspergillus steynii IBT 23096]
MSYFWSDDEEPFLTKLEGTQITVGQNIYRLGELVSEGHSIKIYERHAHFIAQRESDGLACMARLRLQDGHDAKDIAYCAEWGRQIFEREIRPLQLTESMAATPTLLDHETVFQTAVHGYPGGYINAFIMSKVPGRPAEEYELSKIEAGFIKREVIQILDSMQRLGWAIPQGFPDMVHYDRETQTVSMTGLDRGTEWDPNDTEPITEDSYLVSQFGEDIWWSTTSFGSSSES